jgi:hypothetical protein
MTEKAQKLISNSRNLDCRMGKILEEYDSWFGCHDSRGKQKNFFD